MGVVPTGLETISEQRPSSNLNPTVLQAIANSLGESIVPNLWPSFICCPFPPLVLITRRAGERGASPAPPQGLEYGGGIPQNHHHLHNGAQASKTGAAN